MGNEKYVLLASGNFVASSMNLPRTEYREIKYRSSWKKLERSSENLLYLTSRGQRNKAPSQRCLQRYNMLKSSLYHIELNSKLHLERQIQ